MAYLFASTAGRLIFCVMFLSPPLRRYLEMAYWTMETGGKPLAEAIGDSVRWREEVGPHRVTEREVSERD